MEVFLKGSGAVPVQKAALECRRSFKDKCFKAKPGNYFSYVVS